MKYTQPSFSIPVGNGRISQTAYEVAVGLRCPRCEALMTAKHECPKKAGAAFAAAAGQGE